MDLATKRATLPTKRDAAAEQKMSVLATLSGNFVYLTRVTGVRVKRRHGRTPAVVVGEYASASEARQLRTDFGRRPDSDLLARP